jgi:hypothetical protein
LVGVARTVEAPAGGASPALPAITTDNALTPITAMIRVCGNLIDDLTLGTPVPEERSVSKQAACSDSSIKTH